MNLSHQEVDGRARDVLAPIIVEKIVPHLGAAVLGHDDLFNVRLVEKLVDARAEHARRLGHPRGALGPANLGEERVQVEEA